MAGWQNLYELVLEEVVQRGEEGCEIAGYAAKAEEAREDDTRLMEVYRELMALPLRPDYPYEEPSDLAAIRLLRPDGPRRLADHLEDAEWKDKFYGAWLGRCAGCALGKPLENPFYMGVMEKSNGNPGWLNVKLWFEGADAWPIRGYTPGHSRAAAQHGLRVSSEPSQRENIRFMPTDDDIRYTVLGLKMLEERGLDFDAFDVGKLWHRLLSYKQMCTAETQAYLNFARVTSHKQDNREHWDKHKEWVRTHLNPYREWIGAQIRVDGYAYGAAGQPERAAELAWRDASFSHVKNGIYGAMFTAAMIAAAFVEPDMKEVVRIGLSEIPGNCRLAHDIRQAVQIAEEAADQLDLVAKLWEAFKHYNPVHTNNNAALVVASLLHAPDDFETAIATAVLGGWDTDCNGATVGSVMGARLGASKLPGSWTAPLNDKLYAGIPDFHPIAISECAARSHAVFRKLRDDERERRD